MSRLQGTIGELSYIYDPQTDTVHVHHKAACGREDHVAEVLEPYSENPGLLLHQSLGFRAVTAILEVIEYVYHGNQWEECP